MELIVSISLFICILTIKILFVILNYFINSQFTIINLFFLLLLIFILLKLNPALILKHYCYAD